MRRGRRDRGERTSGPPQLGVFVGLPLACTPSVAAMAENAEGDLNSNLLHASYHTGDPQLDTAIGQWLRWDKVGIRSAWHPSTPPAHPRTHNPPFPVPTRCSAGCRGDGSGHPAVPGVAYYLCLCYPLGPSELGRDSCPYAVS